MESLLAACHESRSYLDWHYSLQPFGLLGAKRLVVVAPAGWRSKVEAGWIDEVGQCATIVWWGDALEDETLEAHEIWRADLSNTLPTII